MSDLTEDERTEQRRMWSLFRAIEVALAVNRTAPNAPTIDIMQTAEEMAEFLETGVARSRAPVSRAKQ